MNIPHPGQLRQRLRIGNTFNTVNENGYPVETDTVICSVWAGIEDASSRYFFSGDAENAERGLAFVIRWRSDVRPGMWALWNGEKYIITQIGGYDFQRRYMRLVTSASKGVH